MLEICLDNCGPVKYQGGRRHGYAQQWRQCGSRKLERDSGAFGTQSEFLQLTDNGESIYYDFWEVWSFKFGWKVLNWMRIGLVAWLVQ